MTCQQCCALKRVAPAADKTGCAAIGHLSLACPIRRAVGKARGRKVSRTERSKGNTMSHAIRLLPAAVLLLALPAAAEAQQMVPQRETGFERVERTTYREEVRTEFRECPRTVWTPVTEYRCQGTWVWWDPFRRPYMEYRQVPVTRWEPRQQMVKTPVTVRTQVPEKSVVNVPVTKRWLAEGEPDSSLAKKPDPFSTLKQPAADYRPATPAPRVGSVPAYQPGWQSFRGRRF